MPASQVTILYGSQTGNAEDLAKRIGRHVKTMKLTVTVRPMDDFDLKSLPKQKLVIFVCSTTGHGQEPENMRNFYNFIRRRDLPETCLSNVKFAVYGLGDSSYSKFNYISKILFKRLTSCGAKPIMDLVIGDEQHPFGCDGAIYPKLSDLWNTIQIMFHSEPLSDCLTNESSYLLQMLTGNELEPEDCFKKSFITAHDIITLHCITNTRVTSQSHFQDTRFLCFRSDTELSYEPGDVCSILPTNSESDSMKFIDLLGLNPKRQISIKKRDPGYMINYLYDFIPDGLTLKDLVMHYLDIQSVPKRSFFEYLHLFSPNELEKNKLAEFATTEGQEEVYEYCIQPKRSILEVLQDFPYTSKAIDLEFIFDIVPPIKPRSFSIASFSRAHPRELQLLVGVVSYKTRLKKIRKGLCSNYLANLKPIDQSSSEDDKILARLRLSIKCSSFKLPSDVSNTIIMIGPGLGIAPFRSFIEAQLMSGKLSSSWLYFGCRFQDADYYFAHQLMDYASNHELNLRVAFSREKPKKYVQDLLLEDADQCRELILSKGACIYVAGNSKLPEDLRKTLAKILFDIQEDSDESLEANKYIAQLEQSGKLQYDCW